MQAITLPTRCEGVCVCTTASIWMLNMVEAAMIAIPIQDSMAYWKSGTPWGIIPNPITHVKPAHKYRNTDALFGLNFFSNKAVSKPPTIPPTAKPLSDAQHLVCQGKGVDDDHGNANGYHGR